MSDRRYGADAHNTDYERGREDERAAIVAWLREQLSSSTEVWESANDWALGCIERGDHLAGDDE
ncbi:MAG TPA: hypothetical protein PK478_13505 [Nitrospira sp.]|nr:hypothetical protein [Nitrospira sp.]